MKKNEKTNGITENENEVFETVSEVSEIDESISDSIEDELFSEFQEILDDYPMITLTDEDGEEVDFEFLDLIEYEGEEYVVLLPADEPDDGGEVVILKVEADESDDEKENYVSVDNEETLLAIFNIFKKKFEDVFNFLDNL